MNLRLKMLFFALLGTCNLIAPYQTIKEQQVYSYVANTIDYWFYPNHTHYRLQTLIDDTVYTIQNSSHYQYQWNWQTFSYDVYYSLDYIEQIVRAASLDVIKDEAYKYAREVTNHDTALAIAHYIYNHVLAYCSQTSYLPASVFSNYIGTELRKTVYDLYYQSLEVYTPSYNY